MSANNSHKGASCAALKAMKAGGEKIACLTAYDASFARVLDAAGLDAILVGDSLGIVVQGRETTVPVSMDEMVYHCRCVTRAARRTPVICDMPFMSYHSVDEALRNATRIVQEGGANAVKLEVGEHQVEIVSKLAANGVPCCAHIGLRPQWIHKLGGYQLHARDASSTEQLLGEAQALAAAGADLLVLECVPGEVGDAISAAVEIPVIGIGAGGGCDGQVLVLYDILGITDPSPRFAQDFLHGRGSVQDAVAAYIAEVKSGKFPAAQHIYSA